MATDFNPESACERRELNPKAPCPAPTHLGTGFPSVRRLLSLGALQLLLFPSTAGFQSNSKYPKFRCSVCSLGLAACREKPLDYAKKCCERNFRGKRSRGTCGTLSETSLNAKNLALRGSACRTAEPSLLCF